MDRSQVRRTHFRSCTLCEAICGIAIELDGDRVVSIRGDADDPFSRGHVCPKAVALQDIQDDPDRLRRPVRRTASGWEEVGWDEALDAVAESLARVRREHGRDAVAVYQGNPTVHNYGTMLFAPRLVRALGTRSRFSATSVDQLPHHVAAYHMFGHQLLVPVPDVDRTAFFLILGANPAVSNGSMMTAPGIVRRIRAVRERSGRVVVIDPRRTETAALADLHLAIRPGTDALLLMALLHVIFGEGLAAPGRLADATDGLDAVPALVADAVPERVAEPTGIAAGAIRSLARDLAAASSAAVYGRLGVSTQPFGTVCHWLVNLLNLATGNLDREGGAMFTHPAVDVVARTRGGSIGRWRSRVRGIPEFSGELPVAVLAEEIATPGDGRIRALVTSAGNPVLSTPNGAALDRALAGLEFMVSIDFYVNETTRHARFVLPPTTPLEHGHYDLAFHVLAVRDTAKYFDACLPNPKGTLDDWEIFLGLAARLEGGIGARLRNAALRRFGPRGLLALALRAGRSGVTMRRLRRSPHGIDLGPLRPALPQRLRTPDRRIRAAPEAIAADLARVRERLLAETTGAAGLVLIGRRDLRSNNSWMHNVPRLMRGRERCTLQVNPEDAARCGLDEGRPARVRSRRGEVTVPVEITDAVRPGVVSLPHGWGHDRSGVRLGLARTHPGASANDLTDEALLDEASGNAALNGVPVRLEPAG